MKKKKKGPDAKKVKGTTENVLDELSNVIPGLGGLIKSAAKSDAFRERFEEIDEEIDKRIRDTPLKSASGTGTQPFKRGYEARQGVRREKEEALRDIFVDIFDEHNHVNVIAEIPGMEEKDIKMDLNADILTISAGKKKLKYFKKLRLPCKPKGITKKLYKNGIMEITLAKE